MKQTMLEGIQRHLEWFLMKYQFHLSYVNDILVVWKCTQNFFFFDIYFHELFQIFVSDLISFLEK